MYTLCIHCIHLCDKMTDLRDVLRCSLGRESSAFRHWVCLSVRLPLYHTLGLDSGPNSDGSTVVTLVHISCQSYYTRP